MTLMQTQIGDRPNQLSVEQEPKRKTRQKKLPTVANSQEYTKSYIDAWASGLDIPSIFLYFPNLEALLQGKRVLDIGCGDGDFVDILHSRGIDAQGIDLFHKAMTSNRVQGDFMTFPFNEQYNVIFAHGVFETTAIYSPQVMCFNGKESSYKAEKLNENSPRRMLRRLNELLSTGAFCVFSTYTSPLIFSAEVAHEEGFTLKKYVRTINTDKHPANPKYRATLSPETKYVLCRRRQPL